MKLLRLTVLIALSAALGCAGQGDVDRTQPGRVQKSIFQGEWYYRQTITDVPANTAVAFAGYQGEMDRIRWRITESALVAYRAYSSLPGSENAFTAGENDLTAPIAAFAIDEHFDVKREYNAATGEQTNVISENSSDRPWYEREFIRVDWTKNLVPNLQSYVELLGVTPESFIPEVDKGIDPDRALITPEYIDVTTRFHVESGFCDGVTSWANCAPASIKVRSSFLKIDKANREYLAIGEDNRQTYEPLEYRDGEILKDDSGSAIPAVMLTTGLTRCTPQLMAQLGPEYSIEEHCSPARMEYFQKFGFFRTELDTYDRDHDVTRAGRRYLANRWNIWDGPVRDASGNPVKYLDRKTRKVVFFLNTQFPEALYPAAQELGRQFDQAFRDTVAALRLTEANGGAGVSQEEIDAHAATLPAIFEVRQNACNLRALGEVPTTADWANAHPDAKERALAAMAKAGRPLQEDLSDLAPHNLEQFCTALENATAGGPTENRFVWQRIGDLRFSLLNWIDRPQAAGPLGYGPSSADPLTGEIINGNANIYGAGVDLSAASAAEVVQVINGDIKLGDLISGDDIIKTIAANAAWTKSRQARPVDQAKLDALFEGLPTEADLEKLKNVAPGSMQRRLEKLRGTDLERLLVNEDIALLDPTYRPGDPITQEIIDRVSPVNWALKDGALRRERAWEKFINPKRGNTCIYLAEFADDSIVGWALEQKGKNATREQIIAQAREDIFLGVALHEVGHTVGLRHNFEASTDALNYFDDFWKIRANYPESEWNVRKLPEYRYSSIMDYGAKFNSDIHGLGKYDYAAIKFGYGQLVETFPEAATPIAGDDLRYELLVGDYRDIPSIFSGVENITRRLTEPYANLVQKVRGGLLAGESVSTREVPYRFCSDEYNGSLNCKTWDEGASQAEIVQSAADMYRNYWYFNAFQRDRMKWSLNGYMSRIADRYFDKFSTAYQYFYYYGRYYRNSFFGQDLALAAVEGLNTLHQVLATPETGSYCLPRPETGYDPNVYDQFPRSWCASPQIHLNYFNGGKPYYVGFNDDYYYDITRAGTMYDKLMAIEALTDSEARFYRVDTFGDRRNYVINYFRTWKEPMLNLLQGVFLDRSDLYGGTVENGQYVPPVSLDLSTALSGEPVSGGGPRIAARMSYTVQNYALMYAMAFLNSTLDDQLDISAYLKVSVKGSADDIDYSKVDPANLAEFTDPRSMQTYRAINTPDGRGIAFRLIKELEAVLPTYQEYEAAYKANPNSAQALANFQAAQRYIAGRVETLDDIRLFQDVFASGQQ